MAEGCAREEPTWLGLGSALALGFGFGCGYRVTPDQLPMIAELAELRTWLRVGLDLVKGRARASGRARGRARVRGRARGHVLGLGYTF